VRHTVATPLLAKEAGHIGYDVPPLQRGKGHAAEALRAGLGVAAALGLASVLLFSDAENIASWRTIERCGGVLEAERYSTYYRCIVRRYRIEI
jgi:predicted acetyltransferase